MLKNYRPVPGLRSGHTQSFLAGLKLRRWLKKLGGSAMHRCAKPITVSSEHGTLLGMVSKQAPQDKRLESSSSHTASNHNANSHTTSSHWAILIHGWEGSHDSVYLFCLADALFRQGYNVIRLNLRDHGETYHLNEEPFHAARLEEVAAAVAQLQQKFEPDYLALIGYSMGGNFALRCGLAAEQFGLNLQQIVAVSPPINPTNTMQAIDEIGGYRRYFVNKWHKSIRAKQRAFPAQYQFEQALKLKTLDDLLEYFIATDVIPYPKKQDYLAAYGISADALATIRIPSLIITAKDDPVIPVDDFYPLQEQAKGNDKLQLQITEYGGHCGYIENIRLKSVLEELILSTLPSINNGH